MRNIMLIRYQVWTWYTGTFSPKYQTYHVWNKQQNLVSNFPSGIQLWAVTWLEITWPAWKLTSLKKLRRCEIIHSVLFCLFIIQIKICAKYRDMLPRPRLVFQEPGLRPIGWSPGVPDKSSRGLGSMSRCSAQILICFIACIFYFFYSSVSLVGNFAGLPVCTVPSAIVHCHQNEAGHQTIKAPIMPCWSAAGPSKHSLAFVPQTGIIDR